ncbi:hypothetical protein GCM10022212_15290 [Actimicrobium antarcticum]|uniref:PilY1 beta-propeller domain-containing protein n=1 Tax=Actimicrobium antarcticum TaxID=1051899 RepID=A0ABP7T2D9_9BURK
MPSWAAPLNLANAPLYTNTAVKPQVMINMSKDQQLYFKAYNDYSDLLGNGVVQTTYTNTVEYYGYFNSGICYDYSGTKGRFEPAKVADGNHYCSGKWSGNFLNWATMSRMDAVRKLLYGGMRSTDTSETVLERSYQPMDAHAWAKYYNGADLDKLTPFTVAQTVGTPLTSLSSLTINPGEKTITTTTAWSDFRLGDQIRLDATGAGSAGMYMIGWVSQTPGELKIQVAQNGIPAEASGTFSNWKVTNLTRTGLTLCNVTPDDTSATNRYSQSNKAAPQIRVARGNYALWASNERWQCNWAEEKAGTQGAAGSSNGNVPLISGLDASADNPRRAERGLNALSAPATTGEYIARVQVCVDGLKTGEKCKQYPDGTFKPVGLLQSYGDSDSNLIQFGLMTGSYSKNISGGVLRKDVKDFASEVDAALPSSNGKFTAEKGIVYTMNKLRIYGYDYGEGTYINNDGCTFQMPGLVLTGGGSNQGDFANEGKCSSWGNPMSEIYLESLRYFAGKQPTSSYVYSSGSKDAALGLEVITTWTDPLTPTNYCSSLNTLVFNPSVSTYDGDQMDKLSDLGSTLSAANLTTQIGEAEGINGNKWFVGNSGSSSDGMCTAKTIQALGDATGLCPEGPAQKGTFQMAGAAWYAHTNRIRPASNPVAAVVPASDKTSLKVATYGIQLATSTPKINITVDGKQVTLLPAYWLNAGGRGVYSSGTIVDFKIISQTADAGSFYVNWEDSSQGGDFDQDVWGILSYTVSGSTVKVSTAVVGASSLNQQGFGYVISGTDKDGPHFHSGAYGFNFNDASNLSVTPLGPNTNASGGCNNCQNGQAKTTASYQVTGNGASQLRDPLYYAAKWGGFTDLNNNGRPDLKREWDKKNTNGTSGADGIPDNYFFVTNPAALENSLQQAFRSILTNASSASVASNSASLNTSSYVYQARFNASDWSGQLLAFAIDQAGMISADAQWDAGQVLNAKAPASRVILTYNKFTKAGIPFVWDKLPPSYQLALNTDFTSVNDNLGEQRVNWLRGDKSKEGTEVGQFRARETSILGDIINSNPQYVGTPNGGFPDADYPAFIKEKADRIPMIYVGSNDGMLHGFSATDGSEKLGFIPSRLMATLSGLTEQGTSHRYMVDGSPMVRDAKVNGTWKTFLVGTLAGGGQSVFALDVTDPSSFSATDAQAANIVQWEFTDAVDADLGYTFGQPSIVKMANGRWAAVFGNGYNNQSSGKAFLYIVFLDRAVGKQTWEIGVDYLKLSADTADGMVGTPGTPNGLSEPLPVDVDGNGMVDAVYAGDLAGNVWKFKLGGADPASWGRAERLFTATSANGVVQPITSAPDLIRNPVGGYVVTFGTGRYLQVSDTSDLATQTFYGIWDQDGSAAPSPAITRSVLQQQTMLAEVTAASKISYRLTSNNLVNYTTQKGWYLDLQTPSSTLPQGERVIFNPAIRAGRVIFSTLIPSTTPCDYGGGGWLMELDAVSGSRLSVTPFDVDNNKEFTVGDFLAVNDTSAKIPVSGRRSSIGIPSAPTIIKGEPKREYKILSGSKGGTESVLENAASSSGRLSWREIMR